MQPEIFVPFVFFGFLAAIIIVPQLAKERTKRTAHELVSQALARGQTLDASLVSQLTQNLLDEGNRARNSLGRGVILLALAGGFIAAGYVGGGFDEDVRHGMAFPAIIMGAVGLAFIVLAIIDFAMRKREA
jgi:hypothetical protein